MDIIGKLDERADRRAALICAVLANCHRDPKSRAYSTEDFMPKKAKAKPIKTEKQTAETMLNMLRVWNAAVGGKEEIRNGN